MRHSERVLAVIVVALVLLIGARHAAPWLGWFELIIWLLIALALAVGAGWLVRRGAR